MSADGSFDFAPSVTPEELAKFDLNDFGNAMRLIRLMGGIIDDDGTVNVARSTLLYQLGLGWVGYNGRFWDRKFGEQLARRAAHQVGQKVRGLLDLIKDKGLTPKDAMKFIDGCGSRGGTSAMLGQAEPYLTVEIDDFDGQPMTLNCRNGTVWLLNDAGGFRADLRPHDPADRITRYIDVDFDPAAVAPLFVATVETSLPDPERRGFFHRGQGYSTTGHVHEQVMFICQGLGRDGKSTILDAIRETVGGYGAVGSVATFLDTGQRSAGDASTDIVKLAGDMRMVVLSEPPRGSKLNEGLLKAWTSGSPITARELREKPFDFRPCGKLWMECNALPVARGDDDGLWRRIHPIVFDHQMDVADVDKLLPKKLLAERAGILNWLIAGVGDWLAQGLKPPESVTQALDQYRKLSSPFGDWLTERCLFGRSAEGERTLVKELYADYKAWAEDQGHDKPMSQRSFGDALHQRQVILAGKNSVGLKYRGPIRLKTINERMADQEAAELQAVRAGGFKVGLDLDAALEPGSYEPDEDEGGA